METTLDSLLASFHAHRRVLETQSQLRAYICDHSLYSFQERIDRLADTYALMLDYMERGYKDDSRERVYLDALADTYRLVQDLRVADCRKNNLSYKAAVGHAASADSDRNEIKYRLEGYVTDLAMLGLEPETVRNDRIADLHQRHADYMSRLFDQIFISPQWSEADGNFYLDLLSSPTIDSFDAQLLVSAVTISCVNVFDSRKLQLLCDLFLASSDEKVRQRALVGWALSLNRDETAMMECQRASARKLLGHKQGGPQLMELQKQMIYCVNAEADNRKIQRDIMPTLLKNNQLEITKFGISEKDEDSMRDILHPDADEKAVDEMEATLSKMREMEKSGSDIYFGGFRHMKRYAFFYTLSNWFVPFYTEHPGLRAVTDKGKDCADILCNVLSGGTFCNSDKYSFALAFSQVMDRILENLKEVMRSGSVGMVSVPGNEQNSPTYIRRMYLQDLYRFYQLYSSKGDFRNPFISTRYAGEPNIFAGVSDIFGDTTIGEGYLDLLRFIGKFGIGSEMACRGAVAEICAFHQAPNNREFQLFVAYDRLKTGDAEAALPIFRKWVGLGSDDELALKGLSRCCLLLHRYKEAGEACAQLVRIRPANIVYQLNHCVCLISLGKSDEALPVLYKLNYEHPAHTDVQRVLAWGQMNDGKYEQALGVYQKLCAADEPSADDRLNMGYALWLTGQVREAVAAFRQYVAALGKQLPTNIDTLVEAFGKDEMFLQQQGVTETELRLMADLVCWQR